MIDNYVTGIAMRGLEKKISAVRDGMARIESDATKYVEDAAFKIQRATRGRDRNLPPVDVNKQSFESIATRLEKFAENGFTSSDVTRYGAAFDEDATEVSEEAKMEILIKAASSLVTQGAPNPASTLALLFD